MKVAYCGPLKDYSGYGEANRHAVAALHAAGVDVMPQIMSYSRESSDYGKVGQLVDELAAKDQGPEVDWQVQILHVTPNEYERLMHRGAYHIGHFFWETSKLPEEFVDGLNMMDEIWTGSEANKKAIKVSGVKPPVYVYPQAIETEREWPEAYQVPEFDGYLFYSIFEWTDRKNPEALLKAFYREFKPSDNVGLLIKTYFQNFSMTNRRMIRSKIRRIKSEMMRDDLPPVFLYLDLMDRHQIERVHQTGDCFVSTHRGEGWGIPQVEAALASNPVISTGYGGCHEYFTPKTAKVIPYDLVSLRGMDHSRKWYSSDQDWAEIKPDKLQEAMRWAHDNQADSKKMGMAANKLVTKRFNFKTVGKEMADRLKLIEEQL